MPIAALIFLTLVNLLNYFDRYIVQAVEPTLKSEFALTNTEAGYFISAFVLGYFLFSPLFGYLGDRFDRRRVMAAGLIAWSICTALTAFAYTKHSFLLARIFVGVGEASFAAIVPVYLKGRIAETVTFNRALSIFYVAIPVGSALGFVAGGSIAALYGWRSLFAFAAVPGLALAFGFLFLKPEGLVTEAHESTQGGSLREGLGRIARSPLLLLVIAGYVLNTFALNGVAAFIVRYGTTLKLSEADASAYFGYILVATGLIGTIAGGFLASQLAAAAENKTRALMRFVALSTFLGVPFLGVCFSMSSLAFFLGGCFFAELLIFAGVAPLNAVIVERAPKGFEALTQGVTIFMIQLFGGFLGPVVVGKITDLSGSLAVAMQATTVALALSAILWGMSVRYITRGDRPNESSSNVAA